MSAVDTLLAQLDAAADDAERAELLASCPHDVLEQLNAALIYRGFVADAAAADAAERAAFEAFSQQLDSAPDDAARMAIISAAQRDPQRGPAFLAEWHWQRTASAADWSARYLAMLGVKP